MRYHGPVHLLAHRVLPQIRQQELLRPGDRVGVAVSGGIDSVALLRLLLELWQELGVVLSVVHFNHKLRGAESEADEEFVAELAREHGLEFYCSRGDVAQLAADSRSGVEAAAREMRYEFFRGLLMEGTSEAEATFDGGSDRSAKSSALREAEPQGRKPQTPSAGDAAGSRVRSNLGVPQNSRLDKIATGHSLDDQAETVLMRIIRGTGLRGLGGIHPRLLVEHDSGEGHGEIVRPLLGLRRRDLESYLIEIKQPWREDATNAESKFTRNRVRKLVLPLLEREFNLAIAENLAELSEIARDEEDYWDSEIDGWMGTTVQRSDPSESPLVQIQLGDSAPARGEGLVISRPWLLTEPKAVQRRLIKAVGEEAGLALEFQHIEEILRFAAEDGPAGKHLSLPAGWKAVREPESVLFMAPQRLAALEDYAYALTVPGRITVHETAMTLEALLVTQRDSVPEYNPQQLLRAALQHEKLTVRNWRAGDRYWPGHTKAPKKVKELLQEKHIPQPERKHWPVVITDSEIVWMRGFAVPEKWRAAPGTEAVMIREFRAEELDQEF